MCRIVVTDTYICAICIQFCNKSRSTNVTPGMCQVNPSPLLPILNPSQLPQLSFIHSLRLSPQLNFFLENIPYPVRRPSDIKECAGRSRETLYGVFEGRRNVPITFDLPVPSRRVRVRVRSVTLSYSPPLSDKATYGRRTVGHSIHPIDAANEHRSRMTIRSVVGGYVQYSDVADVPPLSK